MRGAAELVEVARRGSRSTRSRWLDDVVGAAPVERLERDVVGALAGWMPVTSTHIAWRSGLGTLARKPVDLLARLVM